MKAKSSEHSLDKVPFKSLVGLAHVRFDCHGTSLFGSRRLEEVEDLMSDQNIIRDGSTFNKIGLILRDQVSKKRLQPLSEKFGYDLVINIAECNRPIITEFLWAYDLRYQFEKVSFIFVGKTPVRKKAWISTTISRPMASQFV